MNKISSRSSRQKGSSLIEMIIVIFVVLILFDLAILESQSLILIRKQQFEDIAYHIANKEMESLRSTSFESLGNSTGIISDSQLILIPSGAGTFTVADSATYSGLKELTVTVTWNDGTSKSVTLNTLAIKGGLNP